MNATSSQVIKGYELQEQLGAGSFGAVYRAAQPAVGRDVAIKIILPHHANQPDFIRRFEREAQLVARLEHPHIVPLYDYWRDPSGAYLVMRFVRGGSLQTTLQHGPLALDTTVHLLEQLLPALAVAHRQGVVHRDLKPANLLLDEEGNAYLADFGIAKDLRSSNPADQTQMEGLLGSPAYSAPEQLLGEEVTAQTDIYSLGVLLYEMLAGAHPFEVRTSGDLIMKHLQEPLPALRLRRPELPAALDRIIQTATAKDPSQRYPDVLSLLADLQSVVAGGNGVPPAGLLDQMLPSHGLVEVSTAGSGNGSIVATLPVENPFKGLRAFQEADAPDFFGREALTENLVARLGERSRFQRFLVVVGPSGSGKSSVVRAGLIPPLRRGALPGSDQWFVTEMFPGAHPLDELEVALLRVAVNPPASLLEQLQHDERGLSRAVKRILPPDEATELVLMIDQFEEVFTLVEDEAERAHFLDSLAAAVTEPRSRLRVIVTLRADFYDRPLLYPQLGELVKERTAVVVPLTAEELRAAIIGPAERVGMRLEPELVTTIVNDVGKQPGTLPLLEYALTELFERRQGNWLTLEAYQATGGVLGALSRRADELYEGFQPSEQAAVRQLFMRLVTLGEGVEDTRRRVPIAELRSLPGYDQAMPAVIDAYGRYRLLTFDRDPVTHGPTVEVTHEALLRTWERLRGWVDASRDDVRLQRRLQGATAEWLAAGQDPSFLALGARLQQFVALADAGDLALNVEERAYIAASRSAWEERQHAEQARQQRELELAQQLAREQSQAATRLRRRAIYLIGALALASVAALAAGLFAYSTQSNFIRSERLRLAAQATVLLDRNETVEPAALLALRSLRLGYSAQADAALLRVLHHGWERQRYVGHAAGVNDAVFSHDGKYVLTGGAEDKTARLWDERTGRELRQFLGHTAHVWSAVFSPDDRYVLTSSDDGTARLWDRATGQELRQFIGHARAVRDATFSPDGRYVLTASDDATAILWDRATGDIVRRFLGHSDIVYSAVFSPDGKYILTGSEDKTLRLWDVASGKTVRSFGTGFTDVENYPYAVAFSPDGQYVLAGSGGHTAVLWDRETGEQVREFVGHTDLVGAVAFSPDGRRVLTGSVDRTARLWDRETGQELAVFTGHADGVASVAFSPDGKSALTSAIDGTARRWEIPSVLEPRPLIGHHHDVMSVAFSPDGRFVLTGARDATAILWNHATGQQVRTFTDSHDEVYSVAFSPDGRFVLTGGGYGAVWLYDVATGSPMGEFIGHADSSVGSVAFSPDGRYVLTGSDDKTARLWDAQSGKELRVFAGHGRGVLSVAFSPDGKYVLTGSGDKTARLWDAANGKLLRVLSGHTAPVFAVSFSPDGKYVVTGSQDGTARLWNPATGRMLRELTGHTDSVNAVDVSRDGRYVLTGSDDKTARLWDAQSGQELREFIGSSRLSAVAFSPDGAEIVTGGFGDRIVRLWRTDYHDVIRLVCEHLPRDFTSTERVEYNIADTAPTCAKP